MLQHMKSAALALLVVFAPAQGMIVTSLALVLMDLITGVLAARKQEIPITSSGLRRTIAKVFIYEIAIILGFVTQQYLTGASVPVANIIAGFVGITELTSVLENLNILGDGKLLKVVIDKLGSKNSLDDK